MPDAFANCSNFSIHGGTFNNVAGDQNNTVTTYYNYHITPGALAPHAAFHGTQSIGPHQLPPLPLPSTSPYRELVHVIVEIQRTLSPLEELYSDARPLVSLFGPLKAQLGELFQSAAFVGSVVEMIEAIEYFDMPDYLLLQVRSRIAHYTSALTMFLGDIKRYRDGLRDAAVGPSWLRILWFILRAARDPGIEAILFDMKCEVDQFQTPLKQFLAVLQRMDLDINSQRLAPVNREAIHSLLGILKSGLPLFKDVILDFVTIAMVDKGKYIHVPLLWCSSMQDVVAACENVAAQTSRWYSAASELLHNDLRGPSFASITPGTTVKSALVAYGVVFYDDIPNFCPACRSSLAPYEEPCTSWVDCRHCGMEYSLRIDEHTNNAGNVTRQSPPWSMDDHYSILTDKITFHFPSLFREDRPLIVPWSSTSDDLSAQGSAYLPPRSFVHFSRSWAHLVASQVITGLTGELSYLISVLKYLFMLRSPLQRCSVTLRRILRGVHSNILIPDGVLSHTLGSNPSLISLNLISLSINFADGWSCSVGRECLISCLRRLSIPSLEDFSFKGNGGSWCHSCYETIESFLLNNRTLRTLRLDLYCVNDRASRLALKAFVDHTIPFLTDLVCLTISYRPWDHWSPLSKPSIVRDIYDAWKETGGVSKATFRAESTHHKSAADRTRDWYPHPWVVQECIVVDDVSRDRRYIAELSLDKLDSYIGFGIDVYDIFALFLLSRPFHHPDLQDYDTQIPSTPSTDILAYEFSSTDFRQISLPYYPPRHRARSSKARRSKKGNSTRM
ncbi:hypothetical protein HGRIS_009120 [Hohenbuehelia grisea]|uniref:Uncharacterized protein n=1 Tax=Hohenbuehelia grisea TaxID=104357 RepID=A0ABR3J064_9AGAR